MKKNKTEKVKMQRNNRIVIITAAAAALLLAAGMAESAKAMQEAYSEAEEISESLFRLHIVANSDSDEDQALKLKVRDAVIDKMEDVIGECAAGDKSEVMAAVRAKIGEFNETARNVINAEGYGYMVSSSVEPRSFPTKNYGNVSLPAWEYDCLYMKIGSGAGKNWWCVLFPPLCFTEAVSGQVSEADMLALKSELSPEAYEIVTVSKIGNTRTPVVIKFKLIEVMQEIRLKLRSVFG